MDLSANDVTEALNCLQNLATNPLLTISSKNKTILQTIRKSYVETYKSLVGQKRKQIPTKTAPKPKRQKTNKKSKKSDKVELDSNGTDSDYVESDPNDEQTQTHNTNKHIFIEPINFDETASIQKFAAKHGIKGDSPSQFHRFHAKQNKHKNKTEVPMISHTVPLVRELDKYLQCVTNLFYAPIEAMDHSLTATVSAHNNNNNNNQSKEQSFRYSSINLILSPIRKKCPLDEWCPREVALFECAILSKGKQFHEIAKIVHTKNTKQCIEFYYYWKQSSHYKIWKALGRKTKKQINKSQEKLLKRCGEKLDEYHTIYRRKVAHDKEKQIHNNSIQNEVFSANNGMLLDQYGNDNHAHALYYPQAQTQKQAMNGLVNYYPTYYQNGHGHYQWLSSPYGTFPPYMSNAQQMPFSSSNAVQLLPEIEGSNGEKEKEDKNEEEDKQSNEETKIAIPSIEQTNAELIDLTETISINEIEANKAQRNIIEENQDTVVSNEQ